MTKRTIALLLVASATAASTLAQTPAATPAGYHVDHLIHVGGEGRWDYISVNPADHMLYVPRTSHTQAIDPASGKATIDVKPNGLSHGAVAVPAVNRGFISDGKDACVIIFDLKSGETLGKIAAAEDADGILYDAGTNRVLVVCGDAGSLISIAPDVDPKAGKAEAVIDLGGKPEFFAVDSKGKAFVNINDKNEVAVVDLKAAKVINRWPTAPGDHPVGMAMDVKAGHLFVGCRNQKLLVMSAEDGKVLADLPAGKGIDACAFDDGNAFASGGDGTMTIARETSPGKFEVVQTVQTPRGARTMTVDPSTHIAYLPAAEFESPATAPAGQGAPRRPAMKPDSFEIVVVAPPAK